MKLEQIKADSLLSVFTDIGFSKEQALLAAKEVAAGRMAEAMVHSLDSSRIDYWGNILTLLERKK